MALDTRATLIDVATDQVRQMGYSAFSFADLADAVGIRKPSIHHHFPTKEDLGVAIVDAYVQGFSEQLDAIDAATGDALARLNAYAGLYHQAFQANRGCLCGMLASEIAVLPPRVQASVRRFFEAHHRWLERTLAGGRSAKRLRPDLDPEREAKTVLAALQGALFVALALGDATSFDHAAAGLLEGLTP